MDTEAIDLDVAEWFVDQFLDQELVTRRAYLGASDGDEAHAAWLALRDWFREVRQNLVPMPDPAGRTAEWLQQNAPELARQRRRVAFLLHRVATEDGELVDAWVSNDAEPQDSVRLSFLLGDFDGELRIVGVRFACPDCWTTGRQGGEACSECDGTGWLHARGRKPPALTILESRQLNRITFPPQLFLNVVSR